MLDIREKAAEQRRKERVEQLMTRIRELKANKILELRYACGCGWCARQLMMCMKELKVNELLELRYVRVCDRRCLCFGRDVCCRRAWADPFCVHLGVSRNGGVLPLVGREAGARSCFENL